MVTAVGRWELGDSKNEEGGREQEASGEQVGRKVVCDPLRKQETGITHSQPRGPSFCRQMPTLRIWRRETRVRSPRVPRRSGEVAALRKGG